MFVYKNTDEGYIERQRVATSGTTIDNEWYNKWQQMTTSDNEWQRVVQQMATRGTTRENEWQGMTTKDNKWHRLATNDNKWQQAVILANFPFFRIREKPTTIYPKETLLTLKRREKKRDSWRETIELGIETSS